MFTLTARTARMLRRPFTRRPHTVSRPVTPRNHLRGPEWLEGRFCPADLWYRGGMTNAFGDPAAWSTSPTAYTPPSNPPGANDNTYFDGAVYGGMCAVVGTTVPYRPTPTAVGSIHVVNDYTGSINFPAAFTVGTLQLDSGQATLNQGSVSADLTITSALNWIAGTLNGTSNLANVIISGATATALIAPAGGGTVNLGSNFTLENGAAATMQEGTIDANKDGLQFETASGSSFIMNPGALRQAIIGTLQFRFDGWIDEGTSLTVMTGTGRIGGAVYNRGTVTLLPDTILSVLGDATLQDGYVQFGDNSATYMQGGASLVSPEPVRIAGGTFATVWSEGYFNGAVINSPTVVVSGGDIYIGMQQGLHVNFGELVITGNVEWSGGTYHPYVQNGGVNFDLWDTEGTGTFTITGGTVAPIYLDSDYGTSSFPTSGDKWKVLQAGGGFVDNTAPSVDNTDLWSLAIDPMAPPKYWELIAK